MYANQIEIIQNLEQSKHLQELQLQTNNIKSLDDSLKELKDLQILRLDSNQIESIKDEEISSCSNLVHLNISENKINSLKVRMPVSQSFKILAIIFYQIFQALFWSPLFYLSD